MSFESDQRHCTLEEILIDMGREKQQPVPGDQVPVVCSQSTAFSYTLPALLSQNNDAKLCVSSFCLPPLPWDSSVMHHLTNN